MLALGLTRDMELTLFERTFSRSRLQWPDQRRREGLWDIGGKLLSRIAMDEVNSYRMWHSTSEKVGLPTCEGWDEAKFQNNQWHQSTESSRLNYKG